jgi:phage terminase small subunit
MAGNSNSGRKRKDLGLHLADGTYRPSRHGPLGDATPTAPSRRPLPERPRAFGPAEREEWKRLTELEHLGAINYALLVAACEMWGLYRASYLIARETPTDKEVRCAVTNYYAQYRTAVITLGATPREQAKLGLITKTQQPAVASRKRG